MVPIPTTTGAEDPSDSAVPRAEEALNVGVLHLVPAEDQEAGAGSIHTAVRRRRGRHSPLAEEGQGCRTLISCAS